MERILFQAIRVLHFSGGLFLAVGELVRRWDAWPYWAFWMDDVMFGALAMAAALLVTPDIIWRRALFAVSHGVGVGMLYGSFFRKIGNPDYLETGNVNADLVVWVIGVIFVLSVVGSVLSIVLYPNGWQGKKD